MYQPVENIEPELIRKLRNGDEKAFEILFYRYKNKINGFVHKMLPPHISSDVIVQDVFVKVWMNRKEIDETRNFSSFLFAISKNLVLDELKSAVTKKLVYTKNNEMEEVMQVSEPDETTEEELEIMFHATLQKLPQRRREIFNLSRFGGLTYKQIAARLNISENTVDTQIRKSLHFLRQEFSNIL